MDLDEQHSTCQWFEDWNIMKVVLVASVIGGYVTTSYLLFKFPNLIHKKKNLKFYCRHISHRGGAGEYLENTLSAFDNAIKNGTDMIEIDLHLTKDEEVVISHDDHLLRATGVDVKISESNYNDLPPLKPALPVDFSGGKLCIGQQNEKIPLLRELFERYPNVAVNIDIKTDNDILIEKVNELIKAYNREHITVWGNFSNIVTDKCRKLNPDIPIYFSARRVMMLVLLTYNGLLPFVPLKESCLELLLPTVLLRKSNVNRSQDKFWSPWVIWGIDKLLMRKALFNHLSKRGIQTYLWVLNEEEDFKRAFELGATGVMTDYPLKLRKYLDTMDLNKKAR